jgi:Dihydroorotate dehydrogenase
VSADLATTVAGLELKNPVIAGSSEATAEPGQIRACLEAGAAAVVAKSVNESPAAHANLRAAEYVLLDEHLHARPLGPAQRMDSLFCRSGLLEVELESGPRRSPLSTAKPRSEMPTSSRA